MILCAMEEDKFLSMAGESKRIMWLEILRNAKISYKRHGSTIGALSWQYWGFLGDKQV